jgi:hypothetical protein
MRCSHRMRTFECRSSKVVVLAGFGCESVVKKSYVTDDQHNYTRVTAKNENGLLHHLQSENQKTHRIRTNNIKPKLFIM